MTDYRFRPKPYGYGATLRTETGWAAVTGSIFLVSGVVYGALAGQIPGGQVVAASNLGICGVLLVASALAFMRTFNIETDGAWLWRMGRV